MSSWNDLITCTARVLKVDALGLGSHFVASHTTEVLPVSWKWKDTVKPSLKPTLTITSGWISGSKMLISVPGGGCLQTWLCRRSRNIKFVGVADDMVTEVSKVIIVVFKVGNDPVVRKIRRLMDGTSSKVDEVLDEVLDEVHDEVLDEVVLA